MVQGRDRRVELGYQLAINCRKSIVYPLKNKNSKFNPLPGGGVNPAAGGSKSASGAAEESSTKSNHNAVKASA